MPSNCSIGAIARSFQVHLWSFFLLITLCVVAGLRVHNLVSDVSRALAREVVDESTVGIVEQIGMRVEQVECEEAAGLVNEDEIRAAAVTSAA